MARSCLLSEVKHGAPLLERAAHTPSSARRELRSLPSEARSRASHTQRSFPAHPHRPGRPRQPTSLAPTAQSPGPPRGDRRPGGGAANGASCLSLCFLSLAFMAKISLWAAAAPQPRSARAHSETTKAEKRPTESKNAHRRDLDFPLGAEVPALVVLATLPMNDHRFRGSHHDTTLINHAMYARDERVVIEIQSATGSAPMHK